MDIALNPTGRLSDYNCNNQVPIIIRGVFIERDYTCIVLHVLINLPYSL